MKKPAGGGYGSRGDDEIRSELDETLLACESSTGSTGSEDLAVTKREKQKGSDLGREDDMVVKRKER
jgi:hypothetical protein